MSTEYVGPEYALQHELDLLGEPKVAVGVIEMVASAHEWVHRRVEQVELLSDKLAFRRVSLDLTVPSPCSSRVEWMDGQEYTLIPLDILAKGPLQRFSLADAAGNPIPALTRRQNGELAWRGLTNLSRLELSGPPDEAPVWLERLLRVVALGDPDKATAALRLLEKWANAGDAQRSELNADARQVWSSEGVRTTAKMLSENFLLIAMVDARPGSRLILKYSYEEKLRGLLDDERSARDRLRERWGWDPTQMSVLTPSFTDCESFHFEVTAPSGVQLLDIVLRDEAREDSSAQRWSLGFKRVAENSPERAHLTTSRTADPDASPSDFEDPRLVVQLRADRNGWLRTAAFAACAVAVFFLASAKWVVSPDHSPTVSNADPAALTAALLGVLSVVLVRSGEHGYTVRLLRPLRHLTFVSASIPMVGAWLLAFPGPGVFRSVGWILLTAASSVLATGLVLVWRRDAPSMSDVDGSIISEQVKEQS